MFLLILFVYFVSFTDKPEKSAPALSPRAVEQRAKWGIATDEKDYPVARLYTDSLQRMGATIHHTSRWFNGATAEMEPETAEKVKRLKFVTAVEMTRDDTPTGALYVKHWIPVSSALPKESDSGWRTDGQLNLHNLKPLHEAGFEGQGILMTICDGGFYNADTLSCFRQNQALGHFDFTDDTDDFYGPTGLHGTYCLSTISGIQEGYHGAAAKAQYYLMRSEEYSTESPKEMDNLVAALEKADSLGVNVFSVSLGYAMFDNAEWTLPKTALDGKSTRVSQAATIAARKGMLVCVAAGNEGDKAWHTICTPADADSVLTVGAVRTDSVIGDFSSYGPSADGRVKPDVCAVGVLTALINAGGNVINGHGTSFATPLLAGLAASLWSALPHENAMQIRERIIRSADRYTSPDTNQYGYGIPDAWKAYTMSTPQGLRDVQRDNGQCTKVLRDGQVLIIRGGRSYDLMGREIINRESR
ncbi:MAG: S8 family serine peptidase [Paludibacteraceae bacterium]|nr:S8 family serine peptidase [Paludibacteraceae bacterium]